MVPAQAALTCPPRYQFCEPHSVAPTISPTNPNLKSPQHWLLKAVFHVNATPRKYFRAAPIAANQEGHAGTNAAGQIYIHVRRHPGQRADAYIHTCMRSNMRDMQKSTRRHARRTWTQTHTHTRTHAHTNTDTNTDTDTDTYTHNDGHAHTRTHMDTICNWNAERRAPHLRPQAFSRNAETCKCTPTYAYTNTHANKTCIVFAHMWRKCRDARTK